jgi:putative ABC transport system permease protein
LPGVRSVAGSALTFVPVGTRLVDVFGVLGASSSVFARGSGGPASDAAFAELAAGRGVTVNRQFAREFRVKVGDAVDLPGAKPPLRLPIVDVSDGVAGSGGGLIALSIDVLARHYGNGAVSTYELLLAPGADEAGVRRGAEQIVHSTQFPVHVYTADEYVGAAATSGDQVIGLFAMTLMVIIACAGIAVLNTLLASVLERIPEIAVLRAIGATQRQVVRSVVAEAVAVGLAGAALGTVAGWVLHRILTERVKEMTSFHIVYRFVPFGAVVAIVAGLGVAALGASVPARRVARLDLLRSLAADAG